MARKSIHDPNQPALPGLEDDTSKKAVGRVYDEFKKMDRVLEDIIRSNPVRPGVEDEFELSTEIAVALKQEIRESGMSRDEFADRVNEFFGRTEERYSLKECRKPLTREDIDKIISDAPSRPIHAYYLYAFQHVLGFGVANAIVGAKGGQVVSEEDRKLLARARIGELKNRVLEWEKILKK